MIHSTSNLSIEVNVWINWQETTGANSILINTKGGSLKKYPPFADEEFYK
jgi:hypothetical protein